MINKRFRLSEDTKNILESVQNDFRNKFNVEVTLSSLVQKAIKDTNKEYENSSFKIINSDWSYQTSFILDNESIQNIEELKLKFKSNTNKSKISSAFVVNQCVCSAFKDKDFFEIFKIK